MPSEICSKILEEWDDSGAQGKQGWPWADECRSWIMDIGKQCGGEEFMLFSEL